MVFTGEMRLADGTAVLVEVADTEFGGIDRVGRAAAVARGTSQTLQEALSHVRPALDAVAESVRGLAHRPDTVRVDFGIKLSAEAGVVVARAATEANFTVSLEWHPGDAPPDPPTAPPRPSAPPVPSEPSAPPRPSTPSAPPAPSASSAPAAPPRPPGPPAAPSTPSDVASSGPSAPSTAPVPPPPGVAPSGPSTPPGPPGPSGPVPPVPSDLPDAGPPPDPGPPPGGEARRHDRP